MFKPVKRFTKKQLKGLDKHDLAVEQIEAEEQRRKQKEKVVCNKEVHTKTVTSSDRSFDNWFDVNCNEEVQLKKRITLKKADGRVVGLDDYENDIFL